MGILAFHMTCVFNMGPGYLGLDFWLYLLIKALGSQDLSLKAGKWARKLERILGLWSQRDSRSLTKDWLRELGTV